MEIGERVVVHCEFAFWLKSRSKNLIHHQMTDAFSHGMGARCMLILFLTESYTKLVLRMVSLKVAEVRTCS